MTKETSQFLATGLEAYDSGLRAMARFREEICKGARGSMARNLKQLAAATKLNLNDSEIKPFARPESFRKEVDEWNHQNCDIGVSLDAGRTDIRAALRWRQEASDEVQRVVYVSFARLRVSSRKEILASARKVEHDAVHEGGGKVWLEKPVTTANIAEFEGMLDELFLHWQKVFQEAGGFPRRS